MHFTQKQKALSKVDISNKVEIKSIEDSGAGKGRSHSLTEIEKFNFFLANFFIYQVSEKGDFRFFVPYLGEKNAIFGIYDKF